MSIDSSKHSELKILHLSSQMTWRGGEQQIAYLISELVKKKCQQWVLCTDGNAMSGYCEKNQIPSFVYQKGIKNFFRNQKIIRQICDEQGIDVVHAHDSKSHTLAFINTLFGKLRSAIVVSRRVDFAIHSSILSKWKYNNKFIKKYICVSNAIKEILAEGVKDKSKLTVVHSGIDLDRFSAPQQKGLLRKELQISSDELIIGNVAALADHKDYYTFIDTVKLLKTKGLKAKYLIVGDGPLKNDIQKYAVLKSLQEDIIFTGFRADIPIVLADFDIFLFTSKTEGLGTSVLDAMASAVPIVSTNAGGIPEIIQHEINGLLCNVGDSDCLAESVLRLVNDITLRDTLVQNAKERVKAFSTFSTAIQTWNIYCDFSSPQS
jgi:L-malate glycosyltransferase